MAKDSKNTNKTNKHFWKDFKAELKKVIWPTPKQVVNNTVAVITIVLITAVIVLVLDLVFDLLNNYGVNKLKTLVDSSVVNEIDNNTVTTNSIEINADLSNLESNIENTVQ